MSAPIRVAVLSPTPTSPTDFGNRKRIERVCRSLRARGATIDFLLYALEDDWRNGYPRNALAEMRNQWDDVHIIVPSVPYHPPAEADDHRIDEWWDPAIETYLGWYLRVCRPDALLVNYGYLSRALELAPAGCLRVLDTHDRLSGRREVLRRLGLGPEFFHTTPEEEAKALDRADLVLAIKEEEAAYFRDLSATPATAVPFVEDRREVDRTPDPDGYLRIGLLGARNNVNVSSTRRFLELALPRFRENIAPIRVVLAGTMCQDLQGYRSHDSVTMLGYLDDVIDFYRQVDVAIVPVESSTGQKIRVGEALGFGVPVIAHEHAFEGYVARHRYHRLSGLIEIADACIDLAFEPSRLGELQAATQASQEAGEQREEDASDLVANVIRTHIPVSWFIVPAHRLEGEPELRLHLASMVSLAASYSRARVLLVGDLEGGGTARPWRRLESFLRRFGSVYSIPDAQLLEAELDAIESAAFWCYDEDALPAVAKLGRDVVLARGFAPDVALAGSITSGLPAVDGSLLVGRLGIQDDDVRLELRESFPMWPVARWVVRELEELTEVEGSDKVLILADPPSSPLVAVAIASAARARTPVVLAVPDTASDPSAIGLAPAEADWLEVITASAARAWLRSAYPAATVDCTLESPSMLPVLTLARLHADRGRGADPWRARALIGNDGLLAAAAGIGAYLAGPTPRGVVAQRRRDDGSGQFWDRMSTEMPRMPVSVPGP